MQMNMWRFAAALGLLLSCAAILLVTRQAVPAMSTTHIFSDSLPQADTEQRGDLSSPIRDRCPQSSPAGVVNADVKTTSNSSGATNQGLIPAAGLSSHRVAVLTYPCIARWQQSGVTKQLRGAMESYVVAVELGLPWAPTALADDHTADCNVPFQSLINLTNLKAAIPQSIVDGFDSRRHYRIEPCHNEDCFVGTEKNQNTWRVVLQSFDLVDRLKRVVAAVKPTEPYVCLHARVEADFERFFQHSPRYKPPMEIVRMMSEYRWSSEIRTLYLAGGNTGAIRSQFLQHQGNHSFRNLISLGSGHEHRTRLERTLIDLAMCQEATIHVGTAGSIWSEWVHDYRKVRNRVSLMYAGDRRIHHLEPFEGVNDDRFFRRGYDGPLVIVDAAVGNYGFDTRDARIQKAVEGARRGTEIVIPGDFQRFFGYDPMPNAKKKLLITARLGESGEEVSREFEEGVSSRWNVASGGERRRATFQR